jgi:hypothetical protein
MRSEYECMHLINLLLLFRTYPEFGMKVVVGGFLSEMIVTLSKLTVIFE